MQIKSYLIVFVAICAIHQISAFNFCPCKDKGIDVCSCKKSITAPRPYPVQVPRLQKPLLKSICKEHVPSGPKPFKAIGDACHCGQQIVKPAPLPRSKPCLSGGAPKFNFELPKPSCNCNRQSNPEPSNDNNCGNAIRAPEQFQNFDNDGATIYFESSRKKSAQQPARPRYAPADVVSVAIAKRLANSAKNGVSERQLQYGSLKDPIVEIKSDRKASNINEESFYDTKGSVLEIQPYVFKRQREESSEEDSEEVKPKKSASDPFNPAQLAFEDIGYGPSSPSKPRYVVVKNSEPVKHECNNRQPKHHHHHRKSQSCDCYKDLVVDQSAVSEQSMSFESANDHQFGGGRFST